MLSLCGSCLGSHTFETLSLQLLCAVWTDTLVFWLFSFSHVLFCDVLEQRVQLSCRCIYSWWTILLSTVILCIYLLICEIGHFSFMACIFHWVVRLILSGSFFSSLAQWLFCAQPLILLFCFLKCILILKKCFFYAFNVHPNNLILFYKQIYAIIYE